MIVDNLEKRGLVRCERGKVHCRFVTVHLTPVGHELIQHTFPGHVVAIVDEVSVLSADEQEQLGALCRKLGLREQVAASADGRRE